MKKILLLSVCLFVCWALFAQQRIKVACVGNSITYGTGLADRATQSYPVQLQKLLGEHYEVENFGKPGATLLNQGHRPYTRQEEYRKALDFAGDIVVIHLGINDTDPRDWPNYRDSFVTDYLNLMDKIKASVFIVHGINDWNVKTNQCVPFFRELEKRGIPVKMMLHQGQHIYIHKLRDSHMLEILERWLEHYLKGVDNGIENEPAVLVESCVDQSVWMHSDTWPPAGCREERFPIKAIGKKLIVDDLAKTVYDKEKDNLKEWLDELVLRDDAEKQHCLQFIWDPFAETAQTETESLRISGTVKLSFDAAIDRETAILSAMLVDLGEACRVTEEEIQHPDGTYTFGLEKEPSAYKVISRGWLNAQNRSCLWSKEKIVPGEFCHYEIDMVPTDHVLASGHKLALILYGIDAEETQRPDTVTNITVDTASIRAAVPMLR